MVATPDGTRTAFAEVRGSANEAEQLGKNVTQLLQAQDAAAILQACAAAE